MRNEIIFFERNGLRHGDFALPPAFADSTVLGLQWSGDSELLMICLRLGSGDAAQYAVQFWTVNNYHWYLKQHYLLPVGTGVSGSALCWDPERAFTFVMATTTGQTRSFEWCWDVCVSASQSRRVAVIDASSILCTPVWKMVVPPPMSESVLHNDTPVMALSAANNATGSIAALLSPAAAATNKPGVPSLRFYSPSRFDTTTATAATALKPGPSAASLTTATTAVGSTLTLLYVITAQRSTSPVTCVLIRHCLY